MGKLIYLLVGLLASLTAFVIYETGRTGVDYGVSLIGDTYRRTLASHTVLDLMLQRFLVQYDVSRIGIARFHVGPNHELVATFGSMTASPGVSDDIANLQYIPAATLALVLPSLNRGEPMFIWTKDVPDGSLKDVLMHRGVKAVLHVPIEDNAHHLIGMVTASWLDENAVPDAAARAEMTGELAQVAKHIAPYLNGLP